LELCGQNADGRYVINPWFNKVSVESYWVISLPNGKWSI
jgi:hypothetical protein